MARLGRRGRVTVSGTRCATWRADTITDYAQANRWHMQVEACPAPIAAIVTVTRRPESRGGGGGDAGLGVSNHKAADVAAGHLRVRRVDQGTVRKARMRTIVQGQGLVADAIFETVTRRLGSTVNVDVAAPNAAGSVRTSTEIT